MSPLDDIFRDHLSAGERLLWCGRPMQGLRLRPSDTLFIPFSLMWGGFAIFWETMAISMKSPWFFRLWGIPFVLVGIYMIIGRFFTDARNRANTFYAVTTERILILSGKSRRKVRSLAIEFLPDLSLSENNSGGGTITFGTPFPLGSATNSTWPGANRSIVPSFELSNDARIVYEIIRAAGRPSGQPS